MPSLKSYRKANKKLINYNFILAIPVQLEFGDVGFQRTRREENRRTRRKSPGARWKQTRNSTQIWPAQDQNRIRRTTLFSLGIRLFLTLPTLLLRKAWYSGKNIGGKRTLSSRRHLCSLVFSSDVALWFLEIEVCMFDWCSYDCHA